ncbi:MAG: citrate synthase [Actinomycetota bacterium]
MPTDEAGRHLIDTAEVARRLGVRTETVYAYVSRGRLHPVPVDGERRSHFDPAEVDALAGRAVRPRSRRRPLEIETAVTAISPTGHRYRGLAATELSRSRRFEEVAEWLWTGRWPDPPPTWSVEPKLAEAARAATDALDPRLARPIDRLRLALGAASSRDPWRFDLSPESVTTSARSTITATVLALPTRGPALDDAHLAARLWPRCTGSDATPELIELLDAALVLLADHELAGSTFAARIAASFRADLGSVLGAAFGPFAGPRHGAMSIAVEELLAGVEAHGAEPALAHWLSRHDLVPGLGHPLYPDGDPRAAELLDRLRRVVDGPELEAAEAVIASCGRRGLPPPNVDLAIGTLSRSTAMVPGAAQACFAVARMAGWVAHALEEYERPSELRPRARYVGAAPAEGEPVR